jgi:hypothetical protein
VIVTNAMYSWCPWANVLYGQDEKFWHTYLPRILDSGFGGELVAPSAYRPGIRRVKFPHGSNSGLGALTLALHWGAIRVLLLGYDAQHTNGKAHCHGDHPPGLGNAGSWAQWPQQFRAMFVAVANVVNCSRVSALDCFPRGLLEDELMKTDEIGVPA